MDFGRNKKTFAMAGALFGVLVVAFLLYSLLAGNMQVGVGQKDALVPARDFSAQDAQGGMVSLSDYIGVPIVLNFWASWCGPCLREMPDFQAAYEELVGEDVLFLMVNLTDGRRETVETANAFLRQNGYTFPVLYDVEYSAAEAYAVRAIPSTVFIDAEGFIVGAVEGTLSREALDTGISLIIS